MMNQCPYFLWIFFNECFPSGPSNRSNSVSSLDLEGESVSELGAGPSGSNGVEALQLLEHEQGVCMCVYGSKSLKVKNK